jgi:hypothetical protein
MIAKARKNKRGDEKIRREKSREELKADDNTMVKDECGKSHNSECL